MTKSKDAWFVYILECKDGRLYTGITTDLVKRFKRHSAGRGAKFTQRNRPSHMIAAKICANKSEASKLEYAIKKLKKPQMKRNLAAAWPVMKNLP